MNTVDELVCCFEGSQDGGDGSLLRACDKFCGFSNTVLDEDLPLNNCVRYESIDNMDGTFTVNTKNIDNSLCCQFGHVLSKYSSLDMDTIESSQLLDACINFEEQAYEGTWFGNHETCFYFFAEVIETIDFEADPVVSIENVSTGNSKVVSSEDGALEICCEINERLPVANPNGDTNFPSVCPPTGP